MWSVHILELTQIQNMEVQVNQTKAITECVLQQDKSKPAFGSQPRNIVNMTLAGWCLCTAGNFTIKRNTWDFKISAFSSRWLLLRDDGQHRFDGNRTESQVLK